MESEPTTDETSPPRTEEGPLVAVSFEKDSERIRKYLESEPKALGTTEILLGIFQISMASLDLVHRYDQETIIHIILSVFVVIGGVVAVAAQNLRLPMVKGSLAAQVFTSLASIFGVLLGLGNIPVRYISYACVDSDWDKNKTDISHVCAALLSTYEHYNGVRLLMYLALTVISVTLAAYSCKVIECCSPKSKMPVIRVNMALPQE